MYKAQKICIVCKGKASGFTFICSRCETLYCEKCAKILSNLENACWVCNEPIDKSKPSKPYKEETSEESKGLATSEGIHKKKKPN